MGIRFSNMDVVAYRQLVKGLLTWLPGLSRLSMYGTGGSTSARYCYSVWLRHLVKAGEKGLTTIPGVVAELGPGDSLGLGLAALLSGADTYHAFDVVAYAQSARNRQILMELSALFKARAAIPDEGEFPEVKPRLDSYEFPSHILTEAVLERALSPGRLEALQGALARLGAYRGIQISYSAPWYDPDIMETRALDLVFSQAVLEHIDDLELTYGALHRWLKPGGLMSHQIDFRCHGTAGAWNGHWTYTDTFWRLLRGKRPYLLNRAPYSVHLALMESQGFEVLDELLVKKPNDLARRQLAPPYRQLSEEDLTTSGAFMLVRKRSSSQRERT